MTLPQGSLKNYTVSMVTAQGTDTKLFDFKDQDWSVPAGGYVVVSTRHPRNTDLAAGKDLSIAEDRDDKPKNDLNNKGRKTLLRCQVWLGSPR